MLHVRTCRRGPCGTGRAQHHKSVGKAAVGSMLGKSGIERTTVRRLLFFSFFWGILRPVKLPKGSPEKKNKERVFSSSRNRNPENSKKSGRSIAVGPKNQIKIDISSTAYRSHTRDHRPRDDRCDRVRGKVRLFCSPQRC